MLISAWCSWINKENNFHWWIAITIDCCCAFNEHALMLINVACCCDEIQVWTSRNGKRGSSRPQRMRAVRATRSADLTLPRKCGLRWCWERRKQLEIRVCHDSYGLVQHCSVCHEILSAENRARHRFYWEWKFRRYNCMRTEIHVLFDRWTINDACDAVRSQIYTSAL